MGLHLGPKATGLILVAGIGSSTIFVVNEGLPYFFGIVRPLPLSDGLQMVLNAMAACFGFLVLFLTVVFATAWAAERRPGVSLLDELDLKRIERLGPAVQPNRIAPNLSDDMRNAAVAYLSHLLQRPDVSAVLVPAFVGEETTDRLLLVTSAKPRVVAGWAEAVHADGAIRLPKADVSRLRRSGIAVNDAVWIITWD